MMAATALAVLLLLGGAVPEPAAEARIVTVTRGAITDTAAITGRLAYADETLTYASVPGLVSQVCVKTGDRVAEGEPLLRLDASGYDAAISAWISAGEANGGSDLHQSLDLTVVRAPMNGVVRQILAPERSAVTPGMPVMLLTSAQQELRCSVAEADVRRLQKGMWARLSSGGETLDRLAIITNISDMTADLITGQPVCEVTLIPDQHIELPEGVRLDAEVYIAGREDVPILPLEAITERDTVWWFDGETCTEIPVKNLLNDEMNVWVDLPEGTRVAVGEFREGQRVREVADDPS